METWDEMIERHKKEKDDFQKNCPHKNMVIKEYVHGYMMHGGQICDYCKDCHKTIAVYKQRYLPIHTGNNFTYEKVGEEERILSEDLAKWYEDNNSFSTI